LHLDLLHQNLRLRDRKEQPRNQSASDQLHLAQPLQNLQENLPLRNARLHVHRQKLPRLNVQNLLKRTSEPDVTPVSLWLTQPFLLKQNQNQYPIGILYL
jgi:hypothetical protein